MAGSILTAADVKRLKTALAQGSAFVGFASVIGTPGTIPAGGTTGQVLTKNSNANFDVGWTTPATFSSIVTYFQQHVAMVYAGAGAPEGVQSAFYGSLYDQDNGFVYRKTSAGYGNTGWNQLL